MKKAKDSQKIAGISGEAVKAKTGKNWQEWIAVLDKVGARKLNHKQIATYLYDVHKVPGWWAQMVTVGYEQAHGLRQKHEKPDGYEISGSKTIEVPVIKAFAAWEDEKLRRKWLKDTGFTIRKATPHKSMRITWVDGKTSVEVNLYSKGVGKSQVAVQHSKLVDAKQAERMKEYWGEQLARLKEVLEAAGPNVSQVRTAACLASAATNRRRGTSRAAPPRQK